MLDGPFLPPVVGRVAYDGWSGAHLESGYSELAVTDDTPWADSATTDATVTRDWLAGRLVTTHDPSQQPSQQSDRYCSPSQHPVAGWIPF